MPFYGALFYAMHEKTFPALWLAKSVKGDLLEIRPFGYELF